jgi:uncharacterized protein (TIGR00299 family) protein
MKIAYLDCFSGISGDMFIGALLDAGLSFENLDEKIRGLPFDGFQIKVNREARSQIFGTRFMVKTEGQEQTPRNLDIIRDIIRKGNLSRWVRDRSISVFEELARVEGKIHNKLPADVHFHEVGAVDSIIDIVGTVYGLEQLGVTSLFVSPLPLGSGFVQTAHGRIPVPAPATTALLKDVPVFDSGTHHEMVTPTGAALVKGLATSFGPMPPMIIEKIGYGVGKRDLSDRPNLARILIGQPQTKGQVDTVVILEANVDDTSPEWLGFLMDRLFNAGALDVIFYPVQMKKNRPGIQIQVMGRPDQKDKLMEIVFRESSTLGIRFRYTQRAVLKRDMVEIESPWGKIRVKKVLEKDGPPFFLPEYEACREVAMKTSLPLREIYYWVMGLNKVK